MNKKIFVSSIASILIVGSAVGSFLYKNVTDRPSFSEISAKKGNVTRVLNLNGKVKSENNADLGFESGGKIIELTHKVGDRVEAGEILARSNNQDLMADYRKNAALARSAEASLKYYEELWKKEKDELRSLKKGDANSSDKDAQRNQIKASEAQVEAQRNNVEAARASVQSIQAQLEKTVIRAPFSGTLAKQDVETGEVAASNAPILTLINENNFKVEIFASEIDASRIRTNDPVEVGFDSLAGKFSAYVASVDPAETLEGDVSAYKVTLRFGENLSGVKSGMEANAGIVLEKKEGVIVVPQKAIYSENEKKFVYASAAGIRERREIKTGIYGDNNLVEVTEGLKEGDIIYEPSK